MKYIKELREGGHIAGIYLCRHHQSAVTKNGKAYDNVILQDKTGTIDAKIWDPNSNGIDDFDALDYVDVVGEVNSYNGSLQVSIRRLRKASEGEYDPADYVPCSEYSVEEMYRELIAYIESVGNEYLKRLLSMWFLEQEEFIKRFKQASAAKTVHHGFAGGLLEHTLGVVRLCEYMAKAYPVLNRDLLITAAICHDIGKVRELSLFPANDYTDDGQLLGHIMIGAEMIHDAVIRIKGFPRDLESKLKHCILAHHGELEFGSPKKPALAEAVALNLADNTDAKLETLKELFAGGDAAADWMGFNRFFESNMRRTGEI